LRAFWPRMFQVHKILEGWLHVIPWTTFGMALLVRAAAGNETKEREDWARQTWCNFIQQPSCPWPNLVQLSTSGSDWELNFGPAELLNWAILSRAARFAPCGQIGNDAKKESKRFSSSSGHFISGRAPGEWEEEREGKGAGSWAWPREEEMRGQMDNISLFRQAFALFLSLYFLLTLCFPPPSVSSLRSFYTPARSNHQSLHHYTPPPFSLSHLISRTHNNGRIIFCINGRLGYKAHPAYIQRRLSVNIPND